ncbi:hypothetical protein H9P43_008421 [Blastocladiella emersonii ATCC 22665]|nr:hypothetical protein H9P43_008421 [Blastocladiella emersonii ATCC 22665]
MEHSDDEDHERRDDGSPNLHQPAHGKIKKKKHPCLTELVPRALLERCANEVVRPHIPEQLTALSACLDHLAARPRRAYPTDPLVPLVGRVRRSPIISPATSPDPSPIPIPPPPCPVYTHVDRGNYVTRDDAVVRYLPDPTALADADTDLGSAHYRTYYACTLTDHADLAVARTGAVDAVARAVAESQGLGPEAAALFAPALAEFGWIANRPGCAEWMRKVQGAMDAPEFAAGLADRGVQVWRTLAQTLKRNPARDAEVQVAHETSLATCAAMYCPDCKRFGCPHVDPWWPTHHPPSAPPAPASDPAATTRAFAKPDLPCSPQCWSLGLPPYTTPADATVFDDLRALLLSSPSSLDLCDAALALGIPCAAAYAQWTAATPVSPYERPLQQSRLSQQQNSATRRTSFGRTVGALAPATAASPSRKSQVSRTLRRAIAATAAPAAAGESGGSAARVKHPPPITLPLHEPCQCPGDCAPDTSDCSCRGTTTPRVHYCDAHCACPSSCPNRWPGCTCTAPPPRKRPPRRNLAGELLPNDDPPPAPSCGGPGCACYDAGRECGAACASSSCRSLRCGNAHVSLGVRDPDTFLRVAPSSVPGAGWGLFARTAFSPGHFLGEYTGEVLSSDEAERRGLVADAMRLNFFFELATDAVVDAMRAGPVLRFINHARGAAANVVPRVVLVEGAHRVAMFARVAVREGAELFVDYGPKYSM